MERPIILDETKTLLDAVGKLAWESYRGNYSFYHSFIEIKRGRLDYIETIINSLNEFDLEDKKIYDSLLDEINRIHEILSNSTKTSNLAPLLENEKEEEKEEVFSEDEINELLESLDNETNLELPTQQLDDYFVPFDFDDFPSESQLQPNDQKRVY